MKVTKIFGRLWLITERLLISTFCKILLLNIVLEIILTTPNDTKYCKSSRNPFHKIIINTKIQVCIK